MRIASRKALVVSFAIVTAAACNSNGRSVTTGSRDANGNPPDATAGARDRAGSPITVTGCLQKSEGLRDTYLLTRINEPPRSVGTGGAGTVERQQLDEAEQTYRIHASGAVKLDDLVGKQVTVTGTMTEKADLADADRDARSKDHGDTARADSSRTDISKGDLARIDASAVTTVADSCGKAAEGGAKKGTAPKSGKRNNRG